MIIPTRTFEDLNSAEGKIKLRDELLSKLNALLMENYIKNIYFTEFVIQ
ncbi:MAG: flagellar basal body-associated FliL family protein [Desulfosarcina sp.]|nr:flagellar basal body-associated FliL family protein [Desulfobacterales bacterium]